MDPIVQAIKEVSNLSLENDKAMLKVIQSLVDKVISIESRVKTIEDKVDMLMSLHRADES